MLKLLRTSRSSRRGISLLEVLISIGVTSVGLLGVMSLIPLAGAQARKGQISERSIVIGLAGAGELQTRGMLNPSNWVDSTGNTVSGALTSANVPPIAVCIDPRRVAIDSSQQFPHSGPTLKMPRVTLPGGTAPNGTVIPTMSKAMADYIFQSQDDLSISQPKDRSKPAYQIMAAADSADLPAATTAFTRRQYEGSMSWMVTLVPKPNAIDTYNRDLYTASIVVFHNRPIEDIAERVANATFQSGGVSGGEVLLTPTDGQGDLDVREGQWIMLAFKSQAAQNTLPYYRWYRVLAADDKGSTQNVTLQGADWNPDGSAVQQAVIMTGVVAVYEKTVRLDSSSLWSN